MDVLSNTEELEVFATKVVVDVIDFSWDSFGKHLHYLGACLHLTYVILFWNYVNEVFLHRDYENRLALLRVLGLCLLYPMVYELL